MVSAPLKSPEHLPPTLDLRRQSPREETSGSPRERRKLATRRTIQIAALRLALELGLDHVTVQAISDAADIAPRTFFTYFSSKDQALAVETPWTGEHLRSLLLARPAGEPMLRSLREVFKEVGDQLTARWEETLLWRELSRRHPELLRRNPEGEEAVVRSLVEAVADQLGTDPEADPYPAVVVNAAVAVGRVALQRWCRQEAQGEGTPSLRSFIDQAFDLMEEGL
jgi:AcrR family transcriptional regulator